jgi:hypothetical protein
VSDVPEGFASFWRAFFCWSDWKGAEEMLGATAASTVNKTAAAGEPVMILTFQTTVKALRVPNDTSILWDMQR